MTFSLPHYASSLWFKVTFSMMVGQGHYGLETEEDWEMGRRPVRRWQADSGQSLEFGQAGQRPSPKRRGKGRRKGEACSVQAGGPRLGEAAAVRGGSRHPSWWPRLPLPLVGRMTEEEEEGSAW